MKKSILTFTTLLFSATSLFAGIIKVTNNANSGIGTLRQAVIDANTNDTIIFADSITTIYFSEVINIDKNITISGNKTNNTTFQNAATWVNNGSSKRYLVIKAGAKVTLNNLTLKDNVGSCSGGAINNVGNLTVNECIFSNNQAYDAGGAIVSFGILTVTNCLFTNNVAPRGSGGAIICGEIATITNSLFIGNRANGNEGGAVRVSSESGATVSISNCTFTGNIASYGGAISNWGTATLCNNIIWNNNNGGAHDVYTGSNRNTIAYHNLIGTSSTDLTGNGNIIGENPLFVGNGDYSLQENSPAIDKGNNTYLPAGTTKDLAGNPRISNGIVDMGAYEYQRKNWCDTLQDSIIVLLDNNNLLQDSINVLHNDISALEIQVCNLKNDTLAKGIFITQLKQALENCDNSEYVMELERQIAGLNKNVSDLNDTVTAKNNIITSLNIEVSGLKADTSRLYNLVVALGLENEKLTDSIIKLLQQLADCQNNGTNNVQLVPQEQIQVFPNPVNYELRIMNYEFKQGDRIELFDMQGKRVYSHPAPVVERSRNASHPETFTIDMSNFQVGNYILRIGNRVAKIIKS
jgi:predicted outer membrane repeat protein